MEPNKEKTKFELIIACVLNNFKWIYICTLIVLITLLFIGLFSANTNYKESEQVKIFECQIEKLYTTETTVRNLFSISPKTEYYVILTDKNGTSLLFKVAGEAYFLLKENEVINITEKSYSLGEVYTGEFFWGKSQFEFIENVTEKLNK